MTERLQGREFIRAQDDEIKALHSEYLRLANEFLELWEKSSDRDEQKNILCRMHAAGTAYYRGVDSGIFDRGSLDGDDFEAWMHSWVSSARSILDELPRYHDLLRYYRKELQLPESMFEPADGAYQCIQQFFAATCPSEVPDLKKKFLDANLPVGGFDRPYLPKSTPTPPPTPKDMKTAMPLFLVIVISFFVLALACIIGGIYAIYKASVADTAFDFMGFHLKTGHVGIAFVGIGLATAYFTVSAVLKKV